MCMEVIFCIVQFFRQAYRHLKLLLCDFIIFRTLLIDHRLHPYHFQIPIISIIQSSIYIMNILESAILRRAHSNRQFYSYSFKSLTNKFGNPQLTYSRVSTPKQNIIKKSRDTISLKQSISRATTSKNTNYSNNPHKCTNCKKKLRSQFNQKSSQMKKRQRKLTEPKKYDFFDLYEQNHNLLISMNENGAKNVKDGCNCVFLQKKIDCAILPEQHKKVFNHKEYENLKVQRGFNSLDFPQFFISQTDSSSFADESFRHFYMINLKNKKFIDRQITHKLFSQLPMKEAAHKLNSFSTKIEDNVFYCCFVKPKNQLTVYPYSETFFWVSQPFKHTQRQKILEIIQKFLSSNLKKYNKNQNVCHYKFLNDKIWIIDWRGTISYIERQNIICIQGGNGIQRENTSINNINIEAICLQMFLNTLHKGQFSQKSENGSLKICPF